MSEHWDSSKWIMSEDEHKYAGPFFEGPVKANAVLTVTMPDGKSVSAEFILEEFSVDNEIMERQDPSKLLRECVPSGRCVLTLKGRWPKLAVTNPEQPPVKDSGARSQKEGQ